MVFYDHAGKLIRITYFSAQRKMARNAMANNDHAKARIHFKLIRNGKAK